MGQYVQTLCQDCILNNFKLRKVDLEDMEENPAEFIRSDVDEDANDRRRAARLLVEELNRHYEDQVLHFLESAIVQLIEFSQKEDNNDRDLYLEATVNLVMALSIKIYQRTRGVIQVSSKVDLLTF